jgi:hypothetical protein
VGGDFEAARQIVGHASVKTTQLYKPAGDRKNRTEVERVQLSGAPLMSKIPAYMVESDFLEAQIEKDVSNYLGYISRLFGPRYRLLESDEQRTGADAEFSWKGRVFFLQFKKPTGLKDPKASALPVTRRKNEAKTQQIRRYRQDEKLADSPLSIFFELRAKARTATDFQHNILRSYEQPPHSRAIYVCPTFLSRAEYERAMDPGWFWRFLELPFRLHDYLLSVNHIAHSFESAPMLRGHATVVPHADVTSSDHYYSFSIHASDVAFHSPDVVRREVTRLSDFMATELRDAYRTRDNLATPSELARRLYDLSRPWAGDLLSKPEADRSFFWLKKHSTLIRQQFSITQMTVFSDMAPGH